MRTRRIISRLLVPILLAAALLACGSPAAVAESAYYIGADLTNQIVTVYSTADDSIVRQMLCSSGAYDATPLGTFYMAKPEGDHERNEWTYYVKYKVYVQYASRIRGGIMFHSIPYTRKSHEYIQQSALRTFGTPSSHGCLRLRWQDAKFICDNCPPGTKVVIYKSGQFDRELRELLLQSSYTIDSGIPYNRYLAIPEAEGELGRYSAGPEVRDLQYRLRDLGYFSGEASGEYRSDTINAVKLVQADLNQEATGVATPEFQALIYDDGAPTAMNVALQDGANGPAVRELQRNLADLMLYGDAIDGVYDVDVAEAVDVFQNAYGYGADGVAMPEIQKAIAYEAERVRLLFPDADSRRMEARSFTLGIGRVSAPGGLRIRELPSSESNALDRLSDGSVVLCLEYGNPWSKIQAGSCVGYVTNANLQYAPWEMSALVYTAPGSDLSYAVGHTEAEYLAGAGLPSVRFAEYLASGGSLESFPDLHLYAQVGTPEPELPLNLRDKPGTNSSVIGLVPNGTELEVLKREAGWSLVEYEQASGYLLNAYLTFRATPRGEDEPPLEAPEEERYTDDALSAVVQSAYRDRAPVYDLDSDDARVLGHLITGTDVDVLESVDGWNHISYQGRTGYMRDEDLRFVEGDIPQ